MVNLRSTFLFLFLSLFWVKSEAVELYSFFDNQCKEVVGYLIAEEDDIYNILSVNGNILNLHKNDIKGILIYNFINPPLKDIKLDKSQLKIALTLSVANEDKLDVFSGFPVQFIEDLVFFLGLNGSIRVHKMDHILKVRPFNQSQIAQLKKKAHLDIQSVGYMQSCASSGQKGAIRPNRILIDRIKIHQFLSNYKAGYESFKSLQERTYLYARPKIYTQPTRFGILDQSPIETSSSAPLPFPFIEWSSGRKPFGVQGLTQIGNVFNEYGADLDPIVGIKLEVKAHFFHSIFVGNVEALPAGSSLFQQYRLLNFDEGEGGLQHTDSALNHMAMVGGDLGAHSLSIALYYPIYLFVAGGQVREVLASNSAYALRYMYTNKLFRFYSLISLNDQSLEDPSNDDIIISEAAALPQSYKVQAFFLRTGIDFDLPGSITTGLNVLILNLDYEEQYKEQPGSSNVKLERMGGTGYFQKSFGEYISLGIRLTYVQNKISGRLGGTSANDKNDQYTLGFLGALIF